MKNKNRNIVVCWTTRNDKKRFRVSEICLDFGLQKRQRDVYLGECSVSNMKFLRKYLENILCAETDTFDIFVVYSERSFKNTRLHQNILII